MKLPIDHALNHKDETDREILPEVKPVYEQLKSNAIARLRADPASERISEIDWVRINGRRLTCMFYLVRLRDGSVQEQFEYYDYRYFDAKPLDVSV